ncbi:MAG: hypothetical protein KTQ12_03560 [Dermatophilaceae bacterium]|jgi:hypothetical protein|nr:hypothetical protein [Dermatophilaceae bacterium]
MPTTYYGSCFDNQHSTIFDPRLPLDPWHAYMNELRILRRNVDNLNAYVVAGQGVREKLEARLQRTAEVTARACTDEQLVQITNEMDEWERHQ